MIKVVISSLLVALLVSCGTEGTDHSKDAIKGSDTTSNSSDGHIFVLPAPLQIATFFRNHEPNAHLEFLSDKSVPVGNYNTDYQRALNLGICITDVGYAALYGNRQLVLDYLARTEELTKALRLDAVAAIYALRIRANIDSPDSLSFLLLSLYNDAQANLNTSSRASTAFYVASGCYIESLALTLQHTHMKTQKEFVSLVAQEKLWVDNLADALTYQEQSEESQDLYNTFYTLQDCYKEIPTSVENNLPWCTFTDASYKRLCDKSVALRNAVITNK